MGKGIPIWRTVRHPETNEITHQGHGIYQPSMDFSLELMNEGEWIHIYPQGRIVMPYERDQELSMRLRWGIGRLIAESKCSPLLLPIYHLGADEVAPIVQPYTLQVIKRMFGPPRHFTVVVGRPFTLPDEVRRSGDTSKSEKESIYAKLTDICQNALYNLRKEALDEHSRHIAQKH
ncbi:hypothetical protein Ciccas_002316 [Cichlidogyrus casuarinus]|uniref:Tafazzin family protein n=1 Tax=Cichlidogyrus casuarinus TaxID=1844966 RepID=A0ABD2QJR6_9PLAT